MIAHLDNGKSTEVRTTAATMGLRVVRWEFDFNDMCELLANPELLEVLATRMPPMPEKTPQRDDTPDKAVEWRGLTDEEMFEIWIKSPAEAEDRFAFARAIEQALKEKNSG